MLVDFIRSLNAENDPKEFLILILGNEDRDVIPEVDKFVEVLFLLIEPLNETSVSISFKL